MSRRCLFLLVFALLVVPGGASAATLGELRPLVLPAGSACVDPSGAPGELAIQTSEGVSFVTATRSGFTPGAKLKFAAPYPCRRIVGRTSGAAVIATETEADGLAVAVRDPGGAWGAPVPLTPEAGWRVEDVEPAVSDRGDVIVAWREVRWQPRTERLLVARRPPGGTLGPAEVVASGSQGLSWFEPGVAATGEALVAYATYGPNRPPYTAGVHVAIAPAGATFAPSVRVADARWLSYPSLDVAADGRALLAVNDGTSMRVAERAPGASFGATSAISPRAPGIFLSPTARLGTGGAAVVAWTRPGSAGGLEVATRPAGGTFSAPAVVTTGRPAAYTPHDPFFASETYYRALLDDDDAELDRLEADARPQLTADGRALYGLTEQSGPGAVALSLASLPPAGGTPMTAPAARSFASIVDATAFVLADGTPAIVWSETDRVPGGETTRVRVAAEGVVSPHEPKPPTVRVGAPLERTLGAADPLRLPIRCSAACVVFATVDSPLAAARATVRLERAGRATLSLDDAAYAAEHGRVRVRLAYGGAGALRPTTRTLHIRLSARADVRLPRIVAVQARRDGNRVRVQFRVSGHDDTLPLYVSGEDQPAYNGEPLVTRMVEVRRSARTTTLTLPARPRMRWVAVRLPFDAGPDAVVVTRVR